MEQQLGRKEKEENNQPGEEKLLNENQTGML